MPLSSKNTLSNKGALTPFVRRFLKCVQNTVARYNLWQAKDSFVLGVSGGPDSLCLLDVLFLLSKKYSFSLHVVHINYRLRGTESDADEQLVRERVAQYQIPFSIFHPRIPAPANLEEKLRNIRYRLFEKARSKNNATRIAVAHQQDDQAETFLLRLLRGSGMSGLSAMRPKNEYIIRPLIEMSRRDILRYLTERHIPYRTDTSNSDLKFFRNRIRNELVPFIEKKYQPRIKKILASTASLLADDYALLEQRFVLPATVSGTDLLFSVQTLKKFPESHLKNQFRLLLAPLYAKKSPPQGTLDELLKIVKSTKGKNQKLALRGLKIERKGDTVRLLNFQR